MSPDIIISIISGFGGAACGWIMNAYYGPSLGSGSNAMNRAGESADTEKSDSANEDSEADRERIVQVADQLRSYATSMTADIDAHQTHIKAVNQSLTDDNAPTTQTAILAAVTELVEANEAMQQRLQQAQDCISDQSQRLESAEKQATTDALTRIANRRAFDDYLAKRHGMGPSKAGVLAILDVDHFKKFNDDYGHRAGDEVLRVVAKTLESNLKDFGLVARFGGEEFAAILHDGDTEQAIQLIEKARRAIGAQQINFEGQTLNVAACAGVATLRPSEDQEGWLQRADDALYASKDAGRNCGHRMDGSMPIRIELKLNSGGTSESSVPPSSDSVKTASEETSQADQPKTVAKQVVAEAKDEPIEKAPPEKTPFSTLPGLSDLQLDFASMFERAKSVGGSVHVLGIRYNATFNNSMMKSLVQIVRAGARSVDQIACLDNRTLVLCLPNSDQGLAADRGLQIVQAFKSVQNGSNANGSKLIGVGVTEASSDVAFEDMVNAASEAANDACDIERDDVLVVTPAV